MKKNKLFFCISLILIIMLLWGCTNNKISISYETNGGMEISTEVVKGNEITEFTLPSDPVKVDCKFAGWYIDADFVNQFQSLEKEDTNVILYAKWDNIKVHYETNGGTEISDKYYSTDSFVLPTTPEKEGYEFAGWYRDTKLLTQFVILRDEDVNFILYAKWSVSPKSLTSTTNFNLLYNTSYFPESIEPNESITNLTQYQLNGSFTLKLGNMYITNFSDIRGQLDINLSINNIINNNIDTYDIIIYIADGFIYSNVPGELLSILTNGLIRDSTNIKINITKIITDKLIAMGETGVPLSYFNFNFITSVLKSFYESDNLDLLLNKIGLSRDDLAEIGDILALMIPENTTLENNMKYYYTQAQINTFLHSLSEYIEDNSAKLIKAFNELSLLYDYLIIGGSNTYTYSDGTTVIRDKDYYLDKVGDKHYYKDETETVPKLGKVLDNGLYYATYAKVLIFSNEAEYYGVEHINKYNGSGLLTFEYYAYVTDDNIAVYFTKYGERINIDEDFLQEYGTLEDANNNTYEVEGFDGVFKLNPFEYIKAEDYQETNLLEFVDQIDNSIDNDLTVEKATILVDNQNLENISVNLDINYASNVIFNQSNISSTPIKYGILFTGNSVNSYEVFRMDDVDISGYSDLTVFLVSFLNKLN